MNKNLTIENLKCCGNCIHSTIGKKLKCIAGYNPKGSFARCDEWDFDGIDIDKRHSNVS